MARAEATRPARIEAVAIVTPNNLHYPMAKAFVEAGFHVICDKPLTTTLQEALDLATIVKRSNVIFGLTHNYTGYPMVRQARQMIADGLLGKIRIVQVGIRARLVGYPLEAKRAKASRVAHRSRAKWTRRQPRRYRHARLQSRLLRHRPASAAKSPPTFPSLSPAARLDDNVQLMLRFAEGAKGALWASQVATGNATICAYASTAKKPDSNGIRKSPMICYLQNWARLPKYFAVPVPAETLPPRMPAAFQRATRRATLKPSHSSIPTLAEQIYARRENRKPSAASLLVPTVEDGVEGMRFIAATLESSKRNAAWVNLQSISKMNFGWEAWILDDEPKHSLNLRFCLNPFASVRL